MQAGKQKLYFTYSESLENPAPTKHILVLKIYSACFGTQRGDIFKMPKWLAWHQALV